MARKRIDKFLKTPLWSELGQYLFEHFQVRFPLQAERVFSEGFGVLFDKDIPWVRQGGERQSSVADYLRGSRIALLVTAPIIWSVAIPLVLLDLMVTLYQAICFPVYGIPTVCRSEFVVIDRHKLAYLSWLEKLNCVYCGYGNGVLAYAREIASRTEERWCPIKHRKSPKHPHPRYEGFADYGDRDSYYRKEDARKRRETKSRPPFTRTGLD
ncbi:MAG: hypothetical protein HQL73_14420 [Magnetococcales bacterium]|nr:hypothetical protein [Magnetococcales bacterium]